MVNNNVTRIGFVVFSVLIISTLFMWSCTDNVSSNKNQYENESPSELNRIDASHQLLNFQNIGDGVNLQPAYACGGEMDLGWDLMVQYPNITTVRIEIEPDKQAPISEAYRWIEEANYHGLNVIATYHRVEDNGSPHKSALIAGANWWKDNYSYLSQAGPFTINLMNEWGSHGLSVEDYVDAYNDAIDIVRQVYSGPLIIDIPGYGQNTRVAALASSQINDNDLIFSAHIYGSAYVGGTGQTMQTSDLDELHNTGRPVIVGEFGSLYGGNADWEALVDHAISLGWPVIGWAWNGDGEDPPMNMISPSWYDDCSANSYSPSSYFNDVYEKLGQNTASCGMADNGYPICCDPNSDTTGDGWGWENNASCYVVEDEGCGTADNGYPICCDPNSDTTGDGWGWENGESCFVESNTCNWYGTEYPICENTHSGWGWENGESCVSQDECNSQN